MKYLTFKRPNARVLIFGYFNYTDINWRDQTPFSGTSAEANEFINTSLKFNLTQLVLEPTRVTKSSANILHLVLTTHREDLSFLAYLRKVSDRKVMHSVFKHLPRQLRPKTISLYDKAKCEAINNELQSFLPDFEDRFQSRSAEGQADYFQKENRAVSKKVYTNNFISHILRESMVCEKFEKTRK